MTAQQIIESNQTKTAKMLALFELGFTRVQVAEMLGVGYGFVQNVYARKHSARGGQLGGAGEWAGFNSKFGVEIEAYGVDKSRLMQELLNIGVVCCNEGYNHETREHWKIVTDSSVNGELPFELVSPPLVGIEGLGQVEKVCGVLCMLGAKVNKSCGLHIHFDASSYDIEAWKNLYFNYAELESSFDSMLPLSRRGNNNRFCQSLRTADYSRKIKSARTLVEIETAITSRSRYHKINTQSYWRQRTVEFRQHSGTVEFVKIKNWILVLAQIMKFSETQCVQGGTFETFKSILQDEQKHYVQERHDKFAV